MRGVVKVKFVDFWPGFEPENNKFVDALRARRRVVVLPENSDECPDILFYSRCGSGSHYRYDCLKIYYTGENDFPNFNECDYAISFYPDSCGGRNLRYPLYMLYGYDTEAFDIIRTEVPEGFCSLVMSNSTNCDPRRIEIVDAVDSCGAVAFGGSYRNNVGGRVADKLKFIGRYRFNLALENSIMPGYVTEKILDAFAAGTVPIYWGSETVKDDFNPDSFIYAGDYGSTEELADAVLEICRDDKRYMSMLQAGCGFARSAARFDARLEEFLNGIADNPLRIVQSYGEIATLYRRNSLLVPLSHNANFMRAVRLFSQPVPTLRKLLRRKE